MSVRSLTGLARFGFSCAAVTVAAASASAAVVPFADDFSSYDVGTSITSPPTPYLETPTVAASTAADFAIESAAGNKRLRGVASATTPAASAAGSVTLGTPITGITSTGTTAAGTYVAGNNFIVSSDLTINSFTAATSSTVSAALSLLSSTQNLGTGGYRVAFAPAGANATATRALTITDIAGSPTGFTGASSAVLPAAALFNGATFTLTVFGDYTTTPGSLLLTARLTDGTNTLTATGTDTIPDSGNNFGFRVAAQAGAGLSDAIDASFDNYSVALAPEPTTLAAVGLLATVGCRRRRA